MIKKSGRPSSNGNLLSLFGALKGKRKGRCEKDPLEKLIELSERLKLGELTKMLMNKKATQELTYIHSSCRTYMNYLHGHPHEQKKSELTSSSRTASLQINHLQYIHTIQAFIRAERTSNWSLHIAATKSILNLLAKTGHTN